MHEFYNLIFLNLYILYIYKFKNMIFKDIHNEKITSSIDEFFVKDKPTTLTTISLIIVLYFIYILLYYNDIKIIIILILLIYLIILLVDNKIYTNKIYSNKIANYNEIKSNLNTGDIIMFRYYGSEKIYDMLLFKFFLPFSQKTYFTHVGIIYKDPSNNIYILESNGEDKYCELTKKIKSGVQLLHYDERFKNIINYRIHVVKTNLHNYIDSQKFYETFFKYKDYTFLQDGIYCVNFIEKIFEENELYKNKNFFSQPCDLLEKKNYKCDVKFEEPIIIVDIE